MSTPRYPSAAVLVVLAVLVAACNATKTVSITSDPAGAHVFLDGKERGITPLTDDLEFEDEDDEFQVLARLSGYEDATSVIEHEDSDNIECHLKLEEVDYVQIPLIEAEPIARGRSNPVIEVSKKPTIAYLETIERSPNVGTVTRITRNEDENVNVGAPVLSPAEDVMVYTVITEEESGEYFSNIIRQAPGTTARTRITFGKWMDLDPCFTPDGQSLVFSSNRTNDNHTLWRVSVNGEGGIAKVTDTNSLDSAPSCSPDGKRIAFASLPLRAEDAEIWTVEASGQLPTQLRVGDQPVVSPGGSRIAFIRRDLASGRRQLWIMSLGGNDETQLTSNVSYDVSDPQWSPDGKWIVYASDEGFDSRKEQNMDVWIMRSDGSEKRQLTTNGSHDDRPCWDHEGKYIYFRSNRGGTWDIWRFEPQT